MTALLFSVKTPRRQPLRTKDWLNEIESRHHADLGRQFKRLSYDRQRLHAEYAIAESSLDHRARLHLSILCNDRKRPPGIEWHRRTWNTYVVSFEDRRRAIRWIIRAFSLGYAVAFHWGPRDPGGGLFHPCDEMFDHEDMHAWEEERA